MMKGIGWIQSLWIVQKPIALWVKTTPEICLKTVEQATLPSINRLYLREVFANGRRYDVSPHEHGFTLTSSATSGWKGRQRVSSACSIHVRIFPDPQTDQTALIITAKIKPFSMFNALWMPLGMVYLIGANPWPRLILALLIGALFITSWLAMRFSAAVDAADMTYFLQKAFEEFQHIQPAHLPAPENPDVVKSADFERMWQRFVQTRQTEHAD